MDIDGAKVIDVAKRLAEVKASIDGATRGQSAAAETLLVAISKKKPASLIAEAIKAGQFTFGENYVQEAAAKLAELKNMLSAEEFSRLELHLTGPLQSNKAKLAAETFSWIQTIDRSSIIKALNKEAGKLAKNLNCLVQVNTSGEESKSGALPDKVFELCEQLLKSENLSFAGLMTIGEYVESTAERGRRVRDFKRLQELAGQVRSRFDLAELQLSMGMSHDYVLAIEEGASIVRVGSAIFGPRENRVDN